MYIIFLAIAYIWLMLLITATTWLSAMAMFIFGGMFLALVYYLLDTPGRKRRRLLAENKENAPL